MTQFDRRSVVVAGLVSAAALATHARAGDAKKDSPKDAPKEGTDDAKRKAVITATATCVAASRACIAACTDHLARGMASMADCQKASLNMLAVCEAMGAAATYNTADAKLLKALASTCALFCRACEKACEPHVAKHEECKACNAACKDCATACEALAA